MIRLFFLIMPLSIFACDKCDSVEVYASERCYKLSLEIYEWSDNYLNESYWYTLGQSQAYYDIFQKYREVGE